MKKVAIKLVLFTVLSSCTSEKVNLIKIEDSNVKAIASVRNFEPNSTYGNLTLRLNSSDSKMVDLSAFRNLMKKYEVPSQFFKFFGEGRKTVVGKKGTILYLDPNDLITKDGKVPDDTIKVELKELLTPNDLVRSKAQTISDGELLESGGSYYINIKCGDKEIVLKDGKILKARFPRMTSETMSLFYGTQNSNGLMNWSNSNILFGSSGLLLEKSWTNGGALYSTAESEFINLVNPGIVYTGTDTTDMSIKEYKEYVERIKKENKAIAEENSLRAKLYDAVGLRSFGWINCDRFNATAERSELAIKFDNENGINIGQAFLVFKDIKSVIQSVYVKGKTPGFYFSGIPNGREVTLIAYGVRDKKIFAYSENFKIGDANFMNIDLKEITEVQYKTLIGA